jgi:hypothetical protein
MALSEIERKRLDWIANAQIGDALPAALFPDSQTWGDAVSEACRAALKEIDALVNEASARAAEQREGRVMDETCRKRLEWMAKGDGSMMPDRLFPMTGAA